MKIIFPVLAVFLLVGCANFTAPARKHELSTDTGYWFDYDASRRGTIMIPKSQSATYAVCSEPAPDVALDLVNKLEGNLTAEDLDIADAKGEITVSAIKLAERTQMVMFLRESLFRLCELSISNSFTADETKDMYLKVVQAALEIVEKDRAEVEKETAEVEKATAEASARAETAKTVNKLIDRGNTLEQLQPFLDR